MKIESLKLEPKQKFLYLFDYGDQWKFEVEFLKEGTYEKKVYPNIIDSRGKAPEQYAQLKEKARTASHSPKTPQFPKK